MIRNFFLSIFSLLAVAILFSACSKHNDEPVIPASPASRVLMVYMLSDNSLRGFDTRDLGEMKKALEECGYDTGTKIVVYRDSTRVKEGITANSELLELVPPTSDNPGGLKVIKSYPDSPSSATPERLSEVIDDVKSSFPADEYSAFFWSHAAAWKPGAKTLPNEPQPVTGIMTQRRNFGDDAGHTLDIDEMAAAIPDGCFDFIWMDCCYMANIETIYQFRNKCRYYIGYPTEVLGEGCPYDKILPFLLYEKIDLRGAAEAMFNDFASLTGSYQSCTIGVFDMEKIEPVVRAFNNAVEGFDPIPTTGLLKYSRYNHGPFYDLEGYVGKVLRFKQKENADSLLYDLRSALADFTIYKNHTEYFLNQILIADEKYYALSTYVPGTLTEKEENFYKSLDWYQATYATKE